MADKEEIIDMTAQEWFEKGSMFTLDFLLPEEQKTMYEIMNLFAGGKVRFATAQLQSTIEEKDKQLEEILRTAGNAQDSLINKISEYQSQLNYWKERCEWCERYVEYSTIEDDSDPVRKSCGTKWQTLKNKQP